MRSVDRGEAGNLVVRKIRVIHDECFAERTANSGKEGNMLAEVVCARHGECVHVDSLGPNIVRNYRRRRRPRSFAGARLARSVHEDDGVVVGDGRSRVD